MKHVARLMSILRSVVVSEKSTILREKGDTLVFKVVPNATKKEIKTAVETILNVEVVSVHTLNMKGKSRRTAHGIGRRSDWKKAYVKLAQGSGQNMDLVADATVDAEKETN